MRCGALGVRGRPCFGGSLKLCVLRFGGFLFGGKAKGYNKKHRERQNMMRFSE